MTPKTFFQTPLRAAQKQYEALRAFYLEEKTASEVAAKFGYTLSSFYSLTRDFKQLLAQSDQPVNRFFVDLQPGPKLKTHENDVYNMVILLRKKHLAVSDIKSILDAQGFSVSETYIYKVSKKEGFARLPRRGKQAKYESGSTIPVTAPKAILLEHVAETFNSPNVGIFSFIPFIIEYGIDKLISASQYPGTKTIPTINSILSFLALKLSNIRRYSTDDLWCMDRGLGLFAGLNVLPKTAWFTSYSHRITREMNISFLKSMNALWGKKKLVSDTSNLDFVSVPYWGDDSHLENNWSGTRHQALSSILAVIAEDPDSGIITYGDTNVRHDGEANVVIEFLDFYRASGGDDLKYLVFDSKFTTYQNLKKLAENGVKFITIRRRGKNIVDELKAMPKSAWKTIRVPRASGKKRQLNVIDQEIFIKDYGKKMRQVAITGHGKIKPALIITNDFDMKVEEIIRKYAKRWLVEKTISEQTHFFHLNRISSSMVIKVDFDLTMTILAHNLYRLFAENLAGYSHHTAVKLYEKFIHNDGKIRVDNDKITVIAKKKRHHPALLTVMNQFQGLKISWLNNIPLHIEAAAHT
jgi:hypothetical protein